MSSHTWHVDLSDGRHQIDVEYSFGSLAQILVDGRLASMSRPVLRMALDRGVDLPVNVGKHEILVSVRPALGPMVGFGYRFGLWIDGRPAPGTDRVHPLAYTRARYVEALAWVYGVSGVVALNHGVTLTTIVFLVAPTACSLVTRRTTFPARVMALVCFGIISLSLTAVAVAGAALR